MRVALLEVARGQNHQDLVLAIGRLGLVEQHQTAGHVVAIEQLARQHDDGLDQVGFDEAAADHVLGIGLLVLPIFFFGLFGLPTEQHTLGHHHHALAACASVWIGLFEGFDDLLHPGPVTIAGRGHAV